MSEWKAKRFWTDVRVVETDGGFAVQLDARPVNTPGKRPLVLPTQTMADAVAAEWDAQTDGINPATMPWTRSANSALDKVAPQMTAVQDHLIEYAGTDMVSYRASQPAELVARQAAAWDPLLDHVRRSYGANLLTTQGVMPITQPEEALTKLRETMTDMSPFALTGFHDLVTIPGSFVVALAAVNRWLDDKDLWALSRLDELWQIEQWGKDDEAEDLAARKESDFLHAAGFFRAAL